MIVFVFVGPGTRSSTRSLFSGWSASWKGRLLLAGTGWRCAVGCNFVRGEMGRWDGWRIGPMVGRSLILRCIWGSGGATCECRVEWRE